MGEHFTDVRFLCLGLPCSVRLSRVVSKFGAVPTLSGLSGCRLSIFLSVTNSVPYLTVEDSSDMLGSATYQYILQDAVNRTGIMSSSCTK